MFNGLMPSEELIKDYSLAEKKQVPYIVRGNVVVTVCFFFLAVILAMGHMKIVGLVTIIPLGVLISAMLMLKKGQLYKGSHLVSVGLLCGIALISFVAPAFNSNLVLYRQALFVVVMCLINMVISYRPNQIAYFSIFSIVLWCASVVFRYGYLFQRNLAEALTNTAVNTLAILVTNIVIINFKKLTRNLMNSFESTNATSQAVLAKVTAVVHESKEGLNIGQKLKDSTDIALTSADRIEELYQFLDGEANNLHDQVSMLDKAGNKVVDQSEKMRKSVNLQTASISGVSAQMELMSANISNINEIAENQRSGINATIESLSAQQKLLERLVNQVEKVKNSSDQIADIVKTINSVSNQTKLLAMNASIEAAHAGISGKGFSVISLEIRKLSEETARNADKINETLEENAAIVSETTESVNEFAAYTKQSSMEMTATMKAIEDILAGISDMNAGSQEMLNSLQNVVKKSDENMEMVETVDHEVRGQGSSIRQISDFSEKLLGRVNELEEMLTNIKNAVTEIKTHAADNQAVAEKISAAIN